jgi:acetyl esterase
VPQSAGGSRHEGGGAISRAALDLDWLNGNVKELRARYERACRIPISGRDRWATIERSGRRLRLLIHEPSAAKACDCAIVYFHGGGWIVGSPETHADVSRALCKNTGLKVISVAYRLAPEHKAPAPIEDGLAALDYLFSSQSGLRHAILCGDSAGGSIAMAVGRNAIGDAKERILGVCSLYGAFGLTASSSLRAFGNRAQGLDAACVRRYWRLANTRASRSPYSIAALGALSRLQVYLLIAGMDPLRDDSLALARALRSQGAAVTVDFHKDESHGFLQDGRARTRVNSSLAGVSRWVRAVMRRRRR